MLTTLLLLVAPALATCVFRQESDGAATLLRVAAQAEPVACRLVTVMGAGDDVDVRLADATGRLRKVKPDHLHRIDGGLQIGVPELMPGGELRVVARVPGDAVTVILGDARPPPAARETHLTRTFALDAKHPAWGFADPKFGETRTEVRLVDPDSTHTFVEPGLRATDVVLLDPGSLTLVVGGVDLVTAASEGVVTTRIPGGWRFDAPRGGEVRYLAQRVGPDLVIPDEKTFVAGTDFHFPEPAVPVRLHGVPDKDRVVRELYDLVRGMVDGRLPGRDALRPRPLNRAWRSGWATPVEKGLILHRMVVQEKVNAAWILTGVHADPITLTGFDTMLLAIEREGEGEGDIVLLDPSCRTCRFGEVSTRLMGRPAIGTALREVPRAPGRLVRTLSLVGESFHARFVATGAAARWLRETAATGEPARAAERVAQALGMPGATIAARSGLDTADGDVEVEVTGASGPRDPFPSPDATPWDGGWADG